MLDASSSIIAFVAVTDLGRAKRFYGQTLGLRVVDEDDFACVFDANGTMLRITVVRQVASPRYTVLGWRVSDIQRTTRSLLDSGVSAVRYPGMDQDELGIWTSPGGERVAWFSDPDGNVLSLTQFF